MVKGLLTKQLEYIIKEPKTIMVLMSLDSLSTFFFNVSNIGTGSTTATLNQHCMNFHIWERIWEKGPIGNFSRHKILCEMWYLSSQI